MVTFANLTSGSVRNDNTTYVTASVTPGANRLVLLAISTFETSTTQPTTPSVTGCGLTWVLVGSFDHDTAGADRSTGFVFRAMGAAPTAGAVTAVFPAAVSRCCWNIDEADGVDTGGTNGSAAVVQFVTATATNVTTLTGTLAAFGNASNAAYGAFGVQAAAGTTFTPGTGFTTLGSSNGQSFALCYTEADGSDTTVDGSWSASGRAGVLAIEVAAGGAAAQNVSPSAIASAEAFGTPSLATGPVLVSPAGVASAEAFGSPTVSPGAVTIAPAGIPTAEAVGSPAVVPGPVTVSPAGVGSAEAFGTPTISVSAVTVAPTSIGSSEAFGTPVVSSGGATIIPTGINSAEAFGSPTISTGPVTIAPSGIASAEAFGSAVVSSGVVVTPTGVASGEAFGLPSVLPGAVNVTPVSIASAEAFGVAVVSFDQVISVAGVTSAEAFGQPTVTAPGLFTPALTPVALAPAAVASANSHILTAVATTNGVDMKTGDLEPGWVIEISDAGQQANLNGVASWRLIGLRGSTLVVNDLAPTVVVNPSEPWRATVTHNWVLGETANTEGFRIEGAVVATWPSNRPQTFPGHSVVHVDFEKALA